MSSSVFSYILTTLPSELSRVPKFSSVVFEANIEAVHYHSSLRQSLEVDACVLGENVARRTTLPNCFLTEREPQALLLLVGLPHVSVRYVASHESSPPSILCLRLYVNTHSMEEELRQWGCLQHEHVWHTFLSTCSSLYEEGMRGAIVVEPPSCFAETENTRPKKTHKALDLSTNVFAVERAAHFVHCGPPALGPNLGSLQFFPPAMFKRARAHEIEEKVGLLSFRGGILSCPDIVASLPTLLQCIRQDVPKQPLPQHAGEESLFTRATLVVLSQEQIDGLDNVCHLFPGALVVRSRQQALDLSFHIVEQHDCIVLSKTLLTKCTNELEDEMLQKYYQVLVRATPQRQFKKKLEPQHEKSCLRRSMVARILFGASKWCVPLLMFHWHRVVSTDHVDIAIRTSSSWALLQTRSPHGQHIDPTFHLSLQEVRHACEMLRICPPEGVSSQMFADLLSTRHHTLVQPPSCAPKSRIDIQIATTVPNESERQVRNFLQTSLVEEGGVVPHVNILAFRLALGIMPNFGSYQQAAAACIGLRIRELDHMFQNLSLPDRAFAAGEEDAQRKHAFQQQQLQQLGLSSQNTGACCICMEAICLQNVTMGICGHLFCNECVGMLKASAEQSVQCPSCRRENSNMDWLKIREGSSFQPAMITCLLQLMESHKDKQVLIAVPSSDYAHDVCKRLRGACDDLCSISTFEGQAHISSRVVIAPFHKLCNVSNEVSWNSVHLVALGTTLPGEESNLSSLEVPCKTLFLHLLRKIEMSMTAQKTKQLFGVTIVIEESPIETI